MAADAFDMFVTLDSNNLPAQQTSGKARANSRCPSSNHDATLTGLAAVLA
jgi:hypothetical protein